MRSTQPGTRFDLHLHSDRSDGRFPQEEVLARCARGGLEVVALTDHDFAPALAPGPRTIDGYAIHLLAGSEVSGMHDGREFHLLVYFPGDVPEGFRTFCQGAVVARAERYAAAAARLALDVPAEMADRGLSGVKALTRFHLAQALIEAGRVASIGEAFSRFLADSHHLVPAIEVTYVEAIRMARSFGGVTSWAHPSLADATRYAATFKAAGLQGLEALRPMASGVERRGLRKLARTLDLFVTGGSDWHGWSHPNDLGLFSVRGHEIRGFLDALEAAVDHTPSALRLAG